MFSAEEVPVVEPLLPADAGGVTWPDEEEDAAGAGVMTAAAWSCADEAVAVFFAAVCRVGLAWFELAVEEELAGDVELGVAGVTWAGAAASPDVVDDAAGVAVTAAGPGVCADEAVDPLVTAAGGIGLLG
ncbi:hypothetical protein [Acidocella aromatica]|uniref:Uncharacterized protein n=1 Tax=Acidocella aromatica TaxID=1303579 RepID=A0A840VDS5_9PROT|nr:hypothetical protein [Acidocella aromatica]MBB5373027.1 hypothetical protein [Acidocella aromatica]